MPIAPIEYPLLNKASAYEGRRRCYHVIELDGFYYAVVQVTSSLTDDLQLTAYQNGTLLLDKTLPADGNHYETKIPMNCLAGDIVEIRIITASNEQAPLNTIKSVVLIGDGY